MSFGERIKRFIDEGPSSAIFYVNESEFSKDRLSHIFIRYLTKIPSADIRHYISEFDKINFAYYSGFTRQFNLVSSKPPTPANSVLRSMPDNTYFTLIQALVSHQRSVQNRLNIQYIPKDPDTEDLILKDLERLIKALEVIGKTNYGKLDDYFNFMPSENYYYSSIDSYTLVHFLCEEKEFDLARRAFNVGFRFGIDIDCFSASSLKADHNKALEYSIRAIPEYSFEFLHKIKPFAFNWDHLTPDLIITDDVSEMKATILDDKPAIYLSHKIEHDSCLYDELLKVPDFEERRQLIDRYWKAEKYWTLPSLDELFKMSLENGYAKGMEYVFSKLPSDEKIFIEDCKRSYCLDPFPYMSRLVSMVPASELHRIVLPRMSDVSFVQDIWYDQDNEAMHGVRDFGMIRHLFDKLLGAESAYVLSKADLAFLRDGGNRAIAAFLHTYLKIHFSPSNAEIIDTLLKEESDMTCHQLLRLVSEYMIWKMEFPKEVMTTERAIEAATRFFSPA